MKLDYSYQKTLQGKVLDLFNQGHKEVVLAAGCSSGKTRMSIELAEKFLKLQPSLKILVLAHGQAILKLQYYKELQEYDPKFTYKLLNSKTESLDTQVTVAIPQSVGRHIKNIDVLIVDEAHQFYLAKTVQDIVERNQKIKKILLLTGTPAEFVREEYPMVVFSVSDLLERGVISDPRIGLLQSEYHYSRKDLSTDNELSGSYKLRDSDTKKTVGMIKGKIVGKTLIACRDTKHARDIQKHLSKHFTTLLSTASNDPLSENIKKFVSGKAQVMIVVYRSILGFSLNDLQTILDLSGSHNPDRLFQLLSRSIRKSDKPKYFYKVTSRELSDYTFSIMSLVMALTQHEVIKTYAGDINNTRFKMPKTHYDSLSNVGGHSDKKIFFEYEFDTLHRKNNGDEYAWTTIGEVKKLINPRTVGANPLRLKLIEMAKAGAARPTKVTKLGKYLSKLTAKASPFRDESFIAEVKGHAPSWFYTPKEILMQEVLSLAHNGKPLPSSKKDSLGERLIWWMRKDPSIKKELMKIRPDWFVSPSDLKKKELIEMASKGGPRPSRRSHPLMTNFIDYVTPSRNAYDPKFVKEIKKVNQKWLT